MKDKLQELNELRNPALRIQRLITERTQAEAITKMNMVKGEKGDPGKTPEKGKDYFTDQDINAVAKVVQSRVKNGIDGISIQGPKGDTGTQGKSGYSPIREIDYWTKTDQENIIRKVLTRIPMPKSVDVKSIISQVTSEIRKTPINIKDIQGVDKLVDYLKLGGFRGGGISDITNLIQAGNNITFTGTGTTGDPYIINSSGGGGGGTVSGNGTDEHIARWSGTNNIQDSSIIIGNAGGGSIQVTSDGDNSLDFFNNGDGYGFTMTGSDGVTSGSSGGNLSFTAGDGSGIGSSAGGTIDMHTGNAASGTAAGGNFDITTGHGFGSLAGGRFQLHLGNGGATGIGGAITLQSGNGGATSGAGGQLQLLAGNATAGNSNGGNLVLYAGVKSGGGTNGTIQLAGGGSSSNALLDISLLIGGDKTYTFPNKTGTLALQTGQTYTVSNVTPDRTFDPTLTNLNEVAMVLATLLSDLGGNVNN